VDKRERQRLKRGRLRKERVRQTAAMHEARAHRRRADELADDAAWFLRARDWASAVAAAARAVALAPHDSVIAGLYAQAAEKSKHLRHRIASLEHLAEVATPTGGLLTLLADLHCTAGNLERSQALLAQAQRMAPRGRVIREAALAAIATVKRRLRSASSAGTSADVPVGDSPLQRELALVKRRGPEPTAPSPPSSSPPPAVQSLSADSPSAPSAASPLAPSVPTPSHDPAILQIPVTVASDILSLDALRAAPSGTPEDVTLALMATALHDAESFDRLLALDHAQGLIQLSHQEETARKVLSVFLGRALLADEVGLGKTIEAGLVLSEYLLRGHVQRALVLTPPSLVRQWREELDGKFGIAARSTDDDERRRGALGPWEGPGVVVASIATARSERHRDAVAACPWDLVIVDEAHTLKNHRTESYALVERLQTRFLLLLTATPIENRVEELYNLVSLIRPGHLGGRTAFVRRFTGARGQLSDTARGELRALLGELMVRNTRALSGVHLPPRFARTQLVLPGPEEHALSEHLVAALRSLVASGRVRPLLSLLLQEAGSSPMAVRGTLERLVADTTLPEPMRAAIAAACDFAARATGSEKARVLLDALAGSDGPTIVFTRFRGTLAFLADVLTRAGLPHQRLDGEMPIAARGAAIERCRGTGGVLLSTDVGSEGLNLQFCHRLVNFDLPWNPMRIEQRIGRLHRIGQDHPVEVLNLCLAGSVEERILGILDERINLFELVVGEVEMILGYLGGGREFPDLVLDAFAEPDATSRTQSFTHLGDTLAAARQRYRTVKSFDEALFRSELGV